MRSSTSSEFSWWEIIGVIHARPLNIISHLIFIPLGSYFLWQHDLLLGTLFWLITVIIVLFTYLTWKDKPNLSRLEKILLKRSTRLNSILAIVSVLLFGYGLWNHYLVLIFGSALFSVFLATFGANQNKFRE